ncbi:MULTISPECIES: hypothetical protein [Salinicola]|uniref:hypothetical protein n=1 Tax=Salinicola TaxID=404432 RepID=UPI0008DDA6C6|nr:MULTISPECIES: hypothetical protein [Salinicola]MDF3919309.1 hypothetical protein [Salinicola salarius]OHZ00001.1 hypothetical protein BC443_09515 [Salinicola sp. MIT1003]
MAEALTQCPKCGNKTLDVPAGDAPDQEVRCTSCGAVVGKRSDFTSDMQKREETFVKEEVADKVDRSLPGSNTTKK